MEIVLANRQKQVPITVRKYGAFLERLASGVFTNLKNQPPDHLNLNELKAIETRGTLSVVIVSNQKMQSLNKIWRNKPKTTDVLSFSLAVEDKQSFKFALESTAMPIEVGEVIISAPRAVSQAREYGHSLDREICFLFVHGFLHVLGFDHMTKAEQKDMFGRQKEVLAAGGFAR